MNISSSHGSENLGRAYRE